MDTERSFRQITRPPADGPFLMEHLFDHLYKIVMDLTGKPARPGRALVFSSCHQGEGASTMALNCATALAGDSALRVALVDGNLRRPSLHEYFGVPREQGLAELIQGDCSPEQAIRPAEPNNLSFMSAGRPSRTLVSLFESAALQPVVEQLRARFDYIIFDSSPILAAPETPLLASSLDGMIMVIEAEKTRWEVARAAQINIERAKVSLVGAMLNKKKLYIPAPIYSYI